LIFEGEMHVESQATARKKKRRKKKKRNMEK